MDISLKKLFQKLKGGEDYINRLSDFRKDAEDLATLFVSFARAMRKKVDPIYVLTWRPYKSAIFVDKALRLLKKRKNVAANQVSDIKSLLEQNSLFSDAALIASDVYDTNNANSIGEWKPSDEFKDLPLVDSGCGLVSKVYVRDNGGSRDFIYAIAGTDAKEMNDWIANVDQLYGNSSQYDLAAENADAISRRISESDTLTFVGHSLGGGIATNNALRTKRRAIVFNPAGLSSDTLAKLDNTVCERADAYVTSFEATNDVLNWGQDTSQEFPGMKELIPSSLGYRYYIKAKGSPLNNHSMNRMIELFEEVRQ